ncbi:MAG: response regulator, partial [Cetobacterium sp.]
MIKCIIVEDEFPAREELKYFINSNGSFEIQNEFENPIDALKYIESNDVEVVFLDINMPELDGMTLGKIINRFNKEIKLIFMSAYKDYAVEAFEIKAFDYILKPYSEERINNVLNNLTEEFSKNSSTIKESNIT